VKYITVVGCGSRIVAISESVSLVWEASLAGRQRLYNAKQTMTQLARTELSTKEMPRVSDRMIFGPCMSFNFEIVHGLK